MHRWVLAYNDNVLYTKMVDGDYKIIYTKRSMYKKQNLAKDWIMNIIIFIILTTIGLLILKGIGSGVVITIKLIANAEARRAIAECEQWKAEASIYPGYYLTGWQEEQCKTYDIEIKLPIRNEMMNHY